MEKMPRPLWRIAGSYAFEGELRGAEGPLCFPTTGANLVDDVAAIPRQESNSEGSGKTSFIKAVMARIDRIREEP